jgi:hypothetical protein
MGRARNAYVENVAIRQPVHGCNAGRLGSENRAVK